MSNPHNNDTASIQRPLPRKAKQTKAQEATKDCFETEECLENGVKKYRKKLKRTSKTVPISVDRDELKEINKDIIGWVYFTGLPQISYPVLQADDNEYYVHRTYDLSSDTSKAGCIFMVLHHIRSGL